MFVVGLLGLVGLLGFLYHALMLQRLRASLALILIALLPFHALLVTVITKMIAGPGHAPLTYLAMWKELVLAAILLIALIEWLQNSAFKIQHSRKADLIDCLILSLIVLSVIIQFTTHYSLLTTNYILGFKYDLLPLLAFLMLRRVSWSEAFVKRAMNTLLCVGGVVALYGIISFLLPDRFFYALGYSDLHSLYIANGPIAAFQQIGGSALRRIQSTMSGPNQLGIWLLIPLAIVLSFERRALSGKGEFLLLIAQGLQLIALFMTFSRAAWLAAIAMAGIALWPLMQSRATRSVILSMVGALLIVVIVAVMLFPSVLVRMSSTRGHLDRPLEAIGQMIDHPFGQGLGSAGPATNRTSDTCVLLRPEDDPSWAKAQPNLCVFLGDTQTQPVDRVCHCPFLPENWYLQIGVEMGWVGMIVYIALIVTVLLRLQALSKKEHALSHSSQLTAHSLLLAFLAVSIAALFLHAWEDSAVAYTVWMLLATVLPDRKIRES